MKLLLFLVIALLVAASLAADYLWKRWVARQREMRERDPDEFRH